MKDEIACTRLIGRLSLCLIGLCVILPGFARAQINGHAEFRNRWPRPDVAQEGTWESTSAYSGHVTPVTDGSLILHWSQIGQAVEGPTLEGGHFLIGEELTWRENSALVPAAAFDAPGGRLYWEPLVVDPDTGMPSDKVFYLPHARRLFAAAAGQVQITWYDLGKSPVAWTGPDGQELGPQTTYIIAGRPARAPVRIYWTDRYDEFGNLTPTGAPAVDVSGFHVVPHYHSAIPARLSDGMDPPVPPNPDDYMAGNPAPYRPEDFDAAYRQYQRALEAYREAQDTRFFWKFGDSFRAQGRTGYIVVEFNADEGTFIDVAIVELRRYSPDRWPGKSAYGPDRYVGTELEPEGGRPATAEAYVSRGLSGDSPYLYQHTVDGPDKGKVYAIRPTTNNLQVEVFWQKPVALGDQYQITWPYEMRRYKATWPDDAQIFVRGHSPDNLGQPVTVPESLHPELMPHQDFDSLGCHATLDGNVVDANGEGLFLLRYSPGTPPGSAGVAFEVVRAVRHDRVRPDMDGELWDILVGTLWPVGTEVTDPYHAGRDPGRIHVCDYDTGDTGYRDVRNDRYAAAIYSEAAAASGQIIPVNAGMLEVWWSNVSQGVQWPSRVVRYRCEWPPAGSPLLRPPIVIGSELGTGSIDPAIQVNWSVYIQNDSSARGYNPNDEHALALDRVCGPVFALRDDLASEATSLPYVLLQYQAPDAGNLWRMDVFPVVRGNLRYSATAGSLIQAPAPLGLMTPYCSESHGVSGPYWRSRKERHWARAAGEDGGTADIVMRFFYPVQDGFYFPDDIVYGYPHSVGDHVPWLDVDPGTRTAQTAPNPETGAEGPRPADVTYTVTWPDGVPELRVGETLVVSRNGLPDIASQASVAIIYQQSIAVGGGPSVHLMDPTRARTAEIGPLPPGLAVEMDSSLGEYRFPELPPHLYRRFSYDGVRGILTFRGVFLAPAMGESYLLPNVITARDRAVLLAAAFTEADIDALNAADPILVSADEREPETADSNFDSRALTAGSAEGTGYVTVAFQDNEDLCAPALPVSLAVLRVTCPLYRGEIKVIEPASPLQEKVTLRHSGDFAGRPQRYIFEWRTLPDTNGTPPTHGADGTVRPEYWVTHVAGTLGEGSGAVDITIDGPGLLTLTDNWFVCRYRPADATCPCGLGWSDWTEPQLSEGWIKRVVRGINPYEQRFEDLGDPTRTLNTLVTMISQAGARPEDDTTPSPEHLDSAGLIDVYQALLDRAVALSLDATPPVSSDAAPALSNSLLLAASRIAQLYMLLGNEAYADAADPTIGIGLNPSESYLARVSSLHAFMNVTSSLLDEELALLRGRDDRLSPDVRQAPVYNRLPWNFSGGLGEVAYALNYDICDDVTGEPDGVLDETDARRLYPQGHGDAWGHYLTAIKGYYTLLTHPNFSWTARSEAVLVGGMPVTVDYLDERLFATIAAARARTGADIVDLTYRARYSEDPDSQWQGYKDDDPERAWGLSGWAVRAGQAAYLDWVVGNAILPTDSRDVGWYVDDVSIVTARQGYVLEFDGVDDYVRAENQAEMKPEAGLTVELWAAADNWNDESAQRLVGCWEGGGYALQTDAAAVGGIARINGNTCTVGVDAATVTAGWHHLAMTWDGRVLRFFLDGVEQDSQDLGDIFPIEYHPTNSVLVGADAGPGGQADPEPRHFRGRLDEVRIWNVARTQAQIRSAMPGVAAPAAEAGLIVYYSFDEMPGATVTDRAAGGHSGALFNMSDTAWQSGLQPVNGQFEQTIFADDFEEGAGRWAPAGDWHLQPDSTLIAPGYHSSVCAMVCNSEAAGGYDPSSEHSLETVASLLVPAAGLSCTLSWWDVVGLDSGGGSVQVLVGVQTVDDNGTPDPGDDVVGYDWEEIYRSEESRRQWGLIDPHDSSARNPVSVGLDAYTGKTIKLRFTLAPDTAGPFFTDVRRIDRTTVPELREIGAASREIQARLDSADAGLSPLGLARNVMPFDIDPQQIDAGRTHFEQIANRAVQALDNTAVAFANANGNTQMLRRQADTLTAFRQNVAEREVDFRNRLIEIFGSPYDDDIGPAGIYPSGYDGPDLYHYMLVDRSELTGVYENQAPTETFQVSYREFEVNTDGSLSTSSTTVTYHIATDGFGIVKPAAWTGSRRAPGELQMALSEMLQARGRFLRTLDDYNGLLGNIEDQAALLQAQYDMNAEEIRILNKGRNTQETFNAMIKGARKRQYWYRTAASAALYFSNAAAEFLPKSVGFSTDVTSGARGAIRLAGSVTAKAMEYLADAEGRAEFDASLAKEIAQAETNIEVTTEHGEFAAFQQLTQLQQMIRSESTMRYDVATLYEALHQAQQHYAAVLARGVRLLEDRLRFRRQTAAQLQEERYKDMAFRIFRNDALQKYRAQFDLAARYVYLAARAYDYETNLLDEDARGAGSTFLTQIVRSRAIGLMQNGQPQLAGFGGDPGLADVLARMMLNWNLVLKGQLGFNNPQTETNRFSLRRELLHLSSSASDDDHWRQILWSFRTPDLLTEPAFRRYCRAFYPQQAEEPGLVIPFATHIEFGTNFFGLPLWGGDSAYDSSSFATKIRSVGVWFSNYNALVQSGLANTPRVYLVPVGQDKMRSPTGYTGETRDWTILDQVIPVPFPVSNSDLTDPGWIPIFDSLVGEFAAVRRYPSFRAYHDNGSFSPDEMATDSRLIGRSVWNTHWLLIIPAGTLHSDRNEALRKFVYGMPAANGPVHDDLGQPRDGNGVADIRLFFQTYAYSGARERSEARGE